MHVTFLMQNTGAIYGAERATLDLLTEARTRNDFAASVLLINELRSRPNSGELASKVKEIVPCELLPTRHAFSAHLVRAIRARLRNRETSCLHTVGYKATLHGGLAAGFGRLKPCVTTVHGWLERRDWKERVYRRVDLQAMRRFQRVIALSTYYETLLGDAGVSRDRIVRIPSGLDLKHDGFCPRRSADDAARSCFTVGMLGRLSAEKNHAMFLNVAKRLVDGGVATEFLLAGDGPMREEILKQIQSLGLEGRVHWRGFLAREDFFPHIDVLVVCSSVENLPYVVLEAMAWSIPVVATRVGGIPDLVVDAENGFLVDFDDGQAMAAAISQLSSDAGARRRLGANGRQRLEAHFTAKRMGDAHMRMYREVVNG